MNEATGSEMPSSSMTLAKSSSFDADPPIALRALSVGHSRLSKVGTFAAEMVIRRRRARTETAAIMSGQVGQPQTCAHSQSLTQLVNEAQARLCVLGTGGCLGFEGCERMARSRI